MADNDKPEPDDIDKDAAESRNHSHELDCMKGELCSEVHMAP